MAHKGIGGVHLFYSTVPAAASSNVLVEFLVNSHGFSTEEAVSTSSKMFLYGTEALASLDESKLERKFDIYQSFGWSDSDICTVVRKLPYCLTSSEDKVRITLKFFMNKLGYESSYLASRPSLLKYSLEKRVMPRNEILKFLKENQLLKGKLSLYTVAKCSELQFLEKYVLSFRTKMPEVYDLYMKIRS
ncbi:hypothetical protein K7X08_002594 [Anisodus acutangulus]|uniref:Uncharacterized protein n=1 Tax=Anisodus acutangulus TaxID=402998 RepID=A0A9Q1LTT5_9SOLA|nr:hypothetical protein K7X08_002594 [Anisodus acutangulus]